METLQEFGISLIQILQTLSPALDAPMEFFTFMGTVEFYMVFITFLYWVVDFRLGFRTFLVLIGTDIVASAFKLLLHQPRPYWIGGVKGMGADPFYGIPSSHASDSLSVWGYLAYRLRRGWLWIFSVLLVLLISISRLYLGVHFPHDLVGGWLIGLVVLILILRYEGQVIAWLQEKSPGYQAGLTFILSILFVIVGLLVRAVIAGTPDPDSWAAFATEARSLTHFFSLSGSLFGSGAGFALMWKRARFKNTGSFGVRLGRYLLGLVGVAIALYGLDVVFGLIAADESTLGYLLRYIRYGTVTFWTMFGAPSVFLKLNLAEPAGE